MINAQRRGTLRPVSEPEGRLLDLPASVELDAADVVLLGVSSDAGAELRKGARLGPASVRAVSRGLGTYSPALGIDVLEELTVVDGGDVVSDQKEVSVLLEAVQVEVERRVRSGQVPGLIGGTQILTLGALRGIRRAKLRRVALLHLSAVHGLRTDEPGESGVIRAALTEGLLKEGGVLQVGLRGPSPDALESGEALRAGFERLTVDNLRWDIHGSMESVRAWAGGRALYISVDLSCLDPSVCPGVTRPVPGGLTCWEVQQVFRSLVSADILGFDIVGMCPEFDHSELTARVAANIIHEVLAALGYSREGARLSFTGGSVGRTSA